MVANMLVVDAWMYLLNGDACISLNYACRAMDTPTLRVDRRIAQEARTGLT